EAQTDHRRHGGELYRRPPRNVNARGMAVAVVSRRNRGARCVFPHTGGERHRCGGASGLRRPMTTHAPSPDSQPDRETNRLLVERGRAGFWLVIGAVVAFGLADFAVNPHVIAALWAIAALQIAVAAVGLAALRGEPSRRRAIGIVVAVLGVVFASGA